MITGLNIAVSDNHNASQSSQDRLAEAIEQLKSRLQLRYEQALPGKAGQVRAIIHAAEAAARHTPFPHLFLPELADEGIARLVATQQVDFATADSSTPQLAEAA